MRELLERFKEEKELRVEIYLVDSLLFAGFAVRKKKTTI